MADKMGGGMATWGGGPGVWANEMHDPDPLAAFCRIGGVRRAEERPSGDATLTSPGAADGAAHLTAMK